MSSSHFRWGQDVIFRDALLPGACRRCAVNSFAAVKSKRGAKLVPKAPMLRGGFSSTPQAYPGMEKARKSNWEQLPESLKHWAGEKSVPPQGDTDSIRVSNGTIHYKVDHEAQRGEIYNLQRYAIEKDATAYSPSAATAEETLKSNRQTLLLSTLRRRRLPAYQHRRTSWRPERRRMS